MAPNLFLSVAITSIGQILSTGSASISNMDLVRLSLISTACLALPVNSLHVGASSSTTTTTTTSSEDPDRHHARILRDIANRNLLYRLNNAVRVADVQLVEALLQEDAEANKKAVPAPYGPENAILRSKILRDAVLQSRWSGDTDSISVTVGNANQSGRAITTSEEIPVTNRFTILSNSKEGPLHFPPGSEGNENHVRIVELLLEGGFRPPCEPADLPEDAHPAEYGPVRMENSWFWWLAAGPDWRLRGMGAASSRRPSAPNLRVLWLLLLYRCTPLAYESCNKKRREPICGEVLQALERAEGPTVVLQLQAAVANCSGPSTPTTTSPTTSTTTSNSMSTKSNSSDLLLSSAVFSLVTAGGVALAEFSATDPRSLAEIGQPLAQNIVRERYRAAFESGRAQQLFSKVGLQVTVGDRVLDAQDVSQQFARLVPNRLDLVRNGDRELSDWEPSGGDSDCHFALALKRRFARPLWPGKSWAALRTSVGNAMPSLSLRLRGLRL